MVGARGDVRHPKLELPRLASAGGGSWREFAIGGQISTRLGVSGSMTAASQRTAFACAAFSSGVASGSNLKAALPALRASSTTLRSAWSGVTVELGSRAASSAPCCLSSAAREGVAIAEAAGGGPTLVHGNKWWYSQGDGRCNWAGSRSSKTTMGVALEGKAAERIYKGKKELSGRGEPNLLVVSPRLAPAWPDPVSPSAQDLPLWLTRLDHTHTTYQDPAAASYA